MFQELFLTRSFKFIDCIVKTILRKINTFKNQFVGYCYYSEASYPITAERDKVVRTKKQLFAVVKLLSLQFRCIGTGT